MPAYAITANRYTETPDGWKGSVQVPTFYLLANVQGIVSEEHAARIAHDVLGTTPETASVTAVFVTLP